MIFDKVFTKTVRVDWNDKAKIILVFYLKRGKTQLIFLSAVNYATRKALNSIFIVYENASKEKLAGELYGQTELWIDRRIFTSRKAVSMLF
jgi:hypothetical protein